MALHIQTFITRTATAVVFAAVMLAGLFWNEYAFISLFAVIMFGCLYEFAKIVKIINAKKYYFFLPVAFVYIIVPLTMMIDLGIHGIENGYSSFIPCIIIFSIWINDTSAYLVGSFIGKTPFSKISPKKTWEGTIGGALLCVMIIGICGSSFFALPKMSIQVWFITAAICAVFGTIGDLLESKLKRMANIKDSGTILPGHGGFLDRFDSILIATPMVWLYFKLFVL